MKMGVIDLQNCDSITEFENCDTKVYMIHKLLLPMNQINSHLNRDRMESGQELVRLGKVTIHEDNPLRATVEGTEDYDVNISSESCTCKDHEFRHIKCKHIWAAIFQHQILTGLIQVTKQ